MDSQLEILALQVVRSEFQNQRRAARDSIKSSPDNFLGWLGELALKFKGLYGSLLAIPGLVAITTFISQAFHPNFIETMKEFLLKNLSVNGLISVEMLAQSLIVFILYWLIPCPSSNVEWRRTRLEIEKKLRAAGFDEEFVRAHSGREYEESHKVAEEFTTRWEFAWLSWALLYLVWGAIYLALSVGKLADARAWLPLTTFIFNLNTLAMYLCYREIVHPSPTWDRDQRKKLYGFSLIILAVFVIQFMGINVGSADNPEGYSSSLELIGKILGVITNFGAGASLALMIGRLESRLISPPTSIVYLLYMYAVMQGTVLFVESKPALLLALTSIALCLKIVLYMLIAWLLDSGVLTFYLAEVRISERISLSKERKVVISCLERSSIRSQRRPIRYIESRSSEPIQKPHEGDLGSLGAHIHNEDNV